MNNECTLQVWQCAARLQNSLFLHRERVYQLGNWEEEMDAWISQRRKRLFYSLVCGRIKKHNEVYLHRATKGLPIFSLYELGTP